MTTNGEARPVERWQDDVIGDVCGPRLEMVLHPLGEYVKFADYECVLHQRDDLEQKLLSSRQQCSDQMAGNEMLRAERYSAADYEALREQRDSFQRAGIEALARAEAAEALRAENFRLREFVEQVRYVMTYHLLEDDQELLKKAFNELR